MQSFGRTEKLLESARISGTLLNANKDEDRGGGGGGGGGGLKEETSIVSVVSLLTYLCFQSLKHIFGASSQSSGFDSRV